MNSHAEANAEARDVSNLTTEEIKSALKGMKRGKTPSENGRRNCNSKTI